MFSFFKSDTKIEKLNKKYQQLQKEAFRLSTTNRSQSDLKYAEAQEILKEIESIEKSGK